MKFRNDTRCFERKCENQVYGCNTYGCFYNVGNKISLVNVFNNNELKIYCDINEVVTETPCSTDILQDLRSRNGRDRLSEDLTRFFRQAEFSDITLCAEDKEIKAHKAILAGRSPVFSGMFRHQMKENVENYVDITDISYETLQQFVAYLYSGQLDWNTLNVESAFDLLVASDKYAVMDLKETVSQFLTSSLTTGNCVQVLFLADSHCNTHVMDAAVDFFAENHKEICAIPDWDDLLKCQPHLTELLKVLLRKLRRGD